MWIMNIIMGKLYWILKWCMGPMVTTSFHCMRVKVIVEIGVRVQGLEIRLYVCRIVSKNMYLLSMHLRSNNNVALDQMSRAIKGSE